MRRLRDLLNGGLEGLLVAFGRDPIAADLAHELKRGGADLLIRCVLVLVTKGDDAATHDQTITRPAGTCSITRPAAPGFEDYPAFALLYGVSSAIRVIAYRDAAPRTEAAIVQSTQIAQNQKTAEAEATAVA